MNRELIEQLLQGSRECEWLEFKVDNAKPEEIGEYISAIANSCVLAEKSHGYVIWGVNNETFNVVGTSFEPTSKEVGNEELKNWLLRQLTPQVNFDFGAVQYDGKPIIILSIQRPLAQPVRWKSEAFIRVGSYKKKLKDHTELERKLWRMFENTPFERQVAYPNLDGKRVLELLDSTAYFEKTEQPLPSSDNAILNKFSTEHFIKITERGKWDILNLGAILFAKKLSEFSTLERKAIRVIKYRGNSRIATEKEREGTKGYANGFEGLIDYVNAILPMNEEIGKALRTEPPLYPELSVRELIANAIIHQDFAISGSGPMVELFDDRLEISNPGIPLVDTDRLLDSSPQSRNEALARFMRRIGVCEERGSGIDKVVFQAEFYQLPAPRFETTSSNMRATLFSPQPLNSMTRDDKTRACYLHACLKYVSGERMSNASLRERFGINKNNSAIASRLIKDAVESGMIKPYDPAVGRKLVEYVPYWS